MRVNVNENNIKENNLNNSFTNSSNNKVISKYELEDTDNSKSYGIKLLETLWKIRIVIIISIVALLAFLLKHTLVIGPIIVYSIFIALLVIAFGVLILQQYVRVRNLQDKLRRAEFLQEQVMEAKKQLARDRHAINNDDNNINSDNSKDDK